MKVAYAGHAPWSACPAHRQPKISAGMRRNEHQPAAALGGQPRTRPWGPAGRSCKALAVAWTAKAFMPAPKVAARPRRATVTHLPRAAVLGNQHRQARNPLLHLKLARLLGGSSDQLLVALQAGEGRAHAAARQGRQVAAHSVPLRAAGPGRRKLELLARRSSLRQQGQGSRWRGNGCSAHGVWQERAPC